MDYAQPRAGEGAFPSQVLADLMDAGFIRGASKENIQPGSLDLSLSEEVYRVEGVFQLQRGETVRELLAQIRKERHNLDEPLARDGLYIARLNESLALPESIYGYCNPKSTTGRLDIHVRVLADGVPRYDSVVPGGWKGELWVIFYARSFWIKMAPGQALCQLRLFSRDTRLSDLELQIALARHRLLNHADGRAIAYHDLPVTDRDGTLSLSLDLKSPIIGWRSIKQDRVINLAKKNEYAPEDFFEPLEARGRTLELRKGEFYILSSLESVIVPPELACEMVPMDDRSGDFRSHYAGFIDPGWGWGKEGEGRGRPLTLEVRPFEDIVMRHNQPVAKIRYERMSALPRMTYDAISSNYTIQTGPRLAKQFKAPQTFLPELLSSGVPSPFGQ